VYLVAALLAADVGAEGDEAHAGVQVLPQGCLLELSRQFLRAQCLALRAASFWCVTGDTGAKNARERAAREPERTTGEQETEKERERENRDARGR
jgi:hypothetical protein